MSTSERPVHASSYFPSINYDDFPAPIDFLTVKIPCPSCDVQRVQIRLLSLLPSSGSGSVKSCFNCFICALGASSGPCEIRRLPTKLLEAALHLLSPIRMSSAARRVGGKIHRLNINKYPCYDSAARGRAGIDKLLSCYAALAAFSGPHFPYFTRVYAEICFCFVIVLTCLLCSYLHDVL